MNKRKTLTNGIIRNNPVFRLVLGTCPTLAVTTSALNGFAMGIAVLVVLLYSNVMISLLRKVIPENIRIAAYVLIIATFVTILELLINTYLPVLYASLGIFLPLIVVNCILLARAEAFAAKNTVLDSAIDGLGMGIGFTLSLTFMGAVRQLLGGFFILPAGGFLIFGLIMAAIVAVRQKYITYTAKLTGAQLHKENK